MGRQMHKLTARTVATVKEPGMHGDGGGLYLQIAKSGTKSWIYRFMLRGRSRDMGLGSADVVSLSEARDLALEARKLVKSGTDPIEARNAQHRQEALKAAATMTFPFPTRLYRSCVRWKRDGFPVTCFPVKKRKDRLQRILFCA